MSPRNVPRFTERGNELPQITQLFPIAHKSKTSLSYFIPTDTLYDSISVNTETIVPSIEADSS